MREKKERKRDDQEFETRLPLIPCDIDLAKEMQLLKSIISPQHLEVIMRRRPRSWAQPNREKIVNFSFSDPDHFDWLIIICLSMLSSWWGEERQSTGHTTVCTHCSWGSLCIVR